ncbi:hypothetical protein [Ekhidna sp.]|uniref:hypothetical protein n=1 Tax=Ekhidna sp. TaxID=2608089 RepID=UPI003B5016F6
MKYLTLIILLFASELSAQITFKNLQSFVNPSLDFKMDQISSRQLTSFQIHFPDLSFSEDKVYISDYKIMSPIQYNLNGYPMSDLSKMDDLLMGTSLSNTILIGGQKIQTTYIFDINGNLRNSQTSFSIGKN